MMDVDFDFPIIKDECQLYIIGLITEEELIKMINKKLDSLGAWPINELPADLQRVLAVTKLYFDYGLTMAEAKGALL